MLLWQLSKERILFWGIRNGIQTAPRVTKLKLVQPKWRGLISDSRPGADGSTCRLGLGAGAGWSTTSYCLVSSAKNYSPSGGTVFWYQSEVWYRDSVEKSIYPLCACSPDTKALCCEGMPAQRLSKVLQSCAPFFPSMSDFLLTRDCETSWDILATHTIYDCRWVHAECQRYFYWNAAKTESFLGWHVLFFMKMVLLSLLQLHIMSVVLVVVTVIYHGLISDLILFSVVQYLKIYQANSQLK